MATVWAITIISKIGDILFQEIVINRIKTGINEKKIRSKINNAVEKTLLDALKDLPGFEKEIDNNSFEKYLREKRVTDEIRKIISVYDNPDIDLLCKAWSELINADSAGKIEILLRTFLNRLKKDLQEIPEVQEILHYKNSYESTSLLQTGLPKIQSTLTQIAENVSKGDTPKGENTLQTRLDTCRDLMKKNRHRAALELLLGIEKELSGKSTSNETRSRHQNQIGLCYYALGEYTNVKKYFDTALTLTPHDSKVLANAALASLIENKIDDAIRLSREALVNNGEGAGASAVFITAEAIKRNYKNLDGIVEEKFLSNTDYVRALGHAYHLSQDFTKAEKYFRLCLAQEPNDFYGLMGLTVILMAPKQGRLYFPTAKKTALEEAANLIKTALNVAEDGDNSYLLSQALAARSGLLLSLGETEKAKADCDKVLGISPNQEIALHNRGIIALLENNYKLAIECLSKLPEEYLISQAIFLPLSEALIMNNNLDEAHDLIEKVNHAQIDLSTKNALRVLHVKVLIKKEDINGVNEIKEQLSKEEQSTDVLLALSQIADLQGNYSKATQYLETAISQINLDSLQVEMISLRLATFYYFHKDFDKSIDWFNKLDENFISDSDLAHIYIQALFTTKKYGDAYKALYKARNLGVNKSDFLEMEAWLAEYFGDPELARDLQKKLIEVEPKKVDNYVQLARLEFRFGNKDEALRILNNINTEKLSDPRELVLAAQMLNFLGEHKTALQLIYRARHLGINLPEVHLAYIWLFTNIDETLMDFKVTSVLPDTAIYLVSDEKTLWIKLITDSKSAGEWDFSPTSEIGNRLVGHKVGEKIGLRTTALENLEYTIQEIQSIYVRAYQESFDDFGTRFPEHNGLQKMRVSDKEIDKIFITAYHRSSLADEVYNAYSHGVISLGQFANLLDVNEIDTFTSLQAIKEQKVFASIGDSLNQKQQRATIAATKESITIDVTALLTLAHLGLLPILKARFKIVYIPRLLIDKIEETLLLRHFEIRKGRNSLGFRDGLPIIEEIPPELIEKNITFLKDLREYVQSNCIVTPIPPVYADHLLVPENSRWYIGLLSICTLLVAKATNTSLYTDDALLGKQAKTNFETNSFWTQILLNDLKQKQIISEDAFNENTAKLLISGYHFTYVNFNLIFRTIEKNNFETNKYTLAVIRCLQGPTTSEDDSINIATNVISAIWSSVSPYENKLYMVDHICSALITGRNFDMVLIKLIDKIKSESGLPSYQSKKLIKQISLWATIQRKVNKL